MDEMRRKNKRLCNLLGVRPHHEMPQGGMPSTPLNYSFPCGRQPSESLLANHAHKEESAGSSNVTVNSKRLCQEDPGL
ncbi:hypothetical protein QJS10_CPB19g00544 [Acorus calamus]|uniref:Uncharacterized protein n=1 Tax=Acorus calamus TaxID=4465 RepID=A0AAV9CHT1_ACOCL|nr:hypothetical protein QJS10_CPB19g00544 [Acorus calamus]